jgi:hypothetical protein
LLELFSGSTDGRIQLNVSQSLDAIDFIQCIPFFDVAKSESLRILMSESEDSHDAAAQVGSA